MRARPTTPPLTALLAGVLLFSCAETSHREPATQTATVASASGAALPAPIPAPATPLAMRCRRVSPGYPVACVTRGDDSGVAVLRSALESFGIDAGDEEALRASCHVTNEGVSIDDLEDVANKRGLDAEQQMAPPHELLDPANLPSIVVVDTEHGTDFWLLWRRDGESILVMDPRLGDEWRSTTLVEGRLHVHEMTVPVSPEALAAHSAVGVSDGGVQLRGGVFVALRKRKR